MNKINFDIHSLNRYFSPQPVPEFITVDNIWLTEVSPGELRVVVKKSVDDVYLIYRLTDIYYISEVGKFYYIKVGLESFKFLVLEGANQNLGKIIECSFLNKVNNNLFIAKRNIL